MISKKSTKMKFEIFLQVDLLYTENVTMPDVNILNGQMGQPRAIENLFRLIKDVKNSNGNDFFYLEAGAYDGITYSNSLIFDLIHGYKTWIKLKDLRTFCCHLSCFQVEWSSGGTKSGLF